MIEECKTTLKVEIKIDPHTYRHFVNGAPMVVHCHHYSTLYTQLAIDAKETDLLAEVSAEMFYDLLIPYYRAHNIESFQDKMTLATLHFAMMGLGKMEVKYLGEYGGKVILTRSHLDRGWMRKWGKNDRPVNFISAGCIAGMTAAIFDKPCNTFKAVEVLSMVKGDPYSEFKVMRR